ncbi:hypothetical protein ORJ66_16190 [Pseudoalteromonas tunicata]|uniref:hypothetical protein n=1 Tax=Pseudoalteromonas tunicata TaxID=314281 RepID=UPI00273F3121|nr:hypothetical protein [Pseudoalteromonas tunicata]MDP5214593.1 hypothetical protein [Pseudoalteromonas tunicata]
MKLLNLLIVICISFLLTSPLSAKEQSVNRVPPPCCAPWPPIEPCVYNVDPEVKIQQFFNTQEVLDPIYIGGERYALKKENFTPIFTTVTHTCPDSDPLQVRYYTGYELSLPVYNDYGQKIFFDIAGKTDRQMSLNVSCGSFSASDAGDKFYISESALTSGSCTTIVMKFNFNRTPSLPRYLDLNLTISEEL